MNYQFKIGDVILVQEWGYGLLDDDLGKYVEITGQAVYFDDDEAYYIKAYNSKLETDLDGEPVSIETFIGKGKDKPPLILLNTIEDQDIVAKQEYSLKHYDTFYQLTDKDIKQGKIKIDAYFVAKQWKVGSKDDSGALFHSLKTIARFGEKNSIEREIKALYNQTLALARIYNVELD